MSKKQYLMMCEQLGNEPDPMEIPPDFGDFPYEVGQAISLHYLLPDRWEGLSATYLGKDFSLLPYLAGLHKVENELQLLQFICIINKIVIDIRAKEQKIRQKQSSKKHK